MIARHALTRMLAFCVTIFIYHLAIGCIYLKTSERYQIQPFFESEPKTVGRVLQLIPPPPDGKLLAVVNYEFTPQRIYQGGVKPLPGSAPHMYLALFESPNGARSAWSWINEEPNLRVVEIESDGLPKRNRWPEVVGTDGTAIKAPLPTLVMQ